MYSKKVSVSSAIVIALLIFYSVDQASALTCYYCESYINGACWKNPTSGIAQYCDTLGYSQMLNSSAVANATIRTAIASGGSDDDIIPLGTYRQYDCAEFVGTLHGQKYIAKMCTIKAVSCEAYGNLLESKIGYKVESCHRCDYSLCNSNAGTSTSTPTSNSSNNAASNFANNAGITSLAISTILAFFFKM